MNALKMTRVVIATTALAVATNAYAEPGLPVAPSWLTDTIYLSIAATGKHVELPHFQYLQRSDGADAFGANPSVTGAGVSFVVGYTLDSNAPFFADRRPRVELRADYFHGRGRTSANLDRRGFIYLVPNDLSFAPVGSADLYGTGKVNSSLNEFDGGLVYKFDAISGQRFTLSPSFGLYGGYALYRNKLSLNYISVDDPTFQSPGFVKDDLRGTRIGGQVGLDMTVPIGPRLTLLGAVGAALFYQHTDYRAQECQNYAIPFNSSCKGDAWRSNVGDSDDTWGVKLSGLMGVAYDMGFVRVAVAGTLAWDNRVPGARHPRLDDLRVASIRHDDKLSYGGQISVSFPLN